MNVLLISGSTRPRFPIRWFYHGFRVGLLSCKTPDPRLGVEVGLEGHVRERAGLDEARIALLPLVQLPGGLDQRVVHADDLNKIKRKVVVNIQNPDEVYEMMT